VAPPNSFQRFKPEIVPVKPFSIGKP